MRLGHAQIGQQEGHLFGGHGGPTIGVQRELARLNALFLETVLDQPLGQFSAFAQGHHPAGDVAAEKIEDHVQVEVCPFGGPEQLGDVPTPQSIGCGGPEARAFGRADAFN